MYTGMISAVGMTSRQRFALVPGIYALVDTGQLQGCAMRCPKCEPCDRPQIEPHNGEPGSTTARGHTVLTQPSARTRSLISLATRWLLQALQSSAPFAAGFRAEGLAWAAAAAEVSADAAAVVAAGEA